MLRLAVAPLPHTLKNSAVDRVVLGARVKALRDRKKWKQADLAKAAHVTENTVRGLERGSLHTRWPKFEAIAHALGTTPEVLLQVEEPITDGHPLLRDLSEEDLRVAQAFHHTRTSVRLRIQRLLAGEPDAGLDLLERIEKLPAEDRASLEGILRISEDKPDAAEPSTTTRTPARKKADR